MQVGRSEAEPAARPGRQDGAVWPSAVDLRDVHKHFGSVQAVRGVALSIGSAQDPQVPEVHLLFGHPGGPAAAVRGGAADVAILRAPFDRRGLDTELLLTEPRVAVLPAGHPLAGRPELRRADLAGQPMPRWAGQADPAAHAHWTGADTPSKAPTQHDQHAETAPGPEINDIGQLLDAVTLGNAVAYVPISVADQHRAADLAFVPVSDLSPSEVMAAWPDTSRSRAVAGFVRAAVEVAASHCEPAAAFA